MAVAVDVAVVSQPPAVDPAAGEPVDPTASAPGQSADLHGPNANAAFGQAQRSENVPPTAADPGSPNSGSQGHGVPGGAPGGPAGPPAAGEGGPQGNNGNGNNGNGNGNNGNGNNGNGNGNETPQPPATVPDSTTPPGQGGGGQPPPQAQGVPAVPPAHEPPSSPPNGQGNGSAGRDDPVLGSAVTA